MTIKTFKRYEIKFVMTKEQAEMIQQAMREHRMELDPFCKKHGSYMIYNVYYDNENLDVIHQSLAKPLYKEKLRMRAYNVPVKRDDMVFLELKKKINGIVVKRRATLCYADAVTFLENGAIPENLDYEDRIVLEEIAQFQLRYHTKPAVYISYERTAWFAKDNADFRISFDQGILTRRHSVTLADYDYGVELIDSDYRVMEVKIIDQMPIWLCNMLSEMGIYKTAFSKYGYEYKKHLAEIRQPVYAPKKQTALVPEYIYK